MIEKYTKNKAINGIILLSIFKNYSLTSDELTDYVNHALKNGQIFRLFENANITLVKR